MDHLTPESCTSHLKGFKFNPKCQVYMNLSYEKIMEHEKQYQEGEFIKNGTCAVSTGRFTGRSPKDKFIVDESSCHNNIWWGSVNQPVKSEVFDTLYNKVVEHYHDNASRAYIFNGFCGVNPATQMQIQMITEYAWQHHFVTNMFIRPNDPMFEQHLDVKAHPDFTIINASNIIDEEWKKHGLNSEVFVIFNLEKRIALIGGTLYGGEMKKGIFSIMNYYLPLKGIMSMHASANIGADGSTALFFGLSGTGKTTLSADPSRFLIGDDEHGWDEEGVFNFEGGCYAKTIGLSAETEPEIFAAIKPNALLENVYIDRNTNEPDYNNSTTTENGRVSYPIYHISNYKKDSRGNHPKHIIFLTCDAYGVLPPVSKLDANQAQYHFLSGYTAKVAGTERGIEEPQATFSSCFGSAFMTLHPTKYADLLKKKIQEHNTRVYLVNTGWSGGAYGVGSRMKLRYTRACVQAVLDGSIEKAECVKDELYGFLIPKEISGVPSNMLLPKNTWADKAAYDATSLKLAKSFVQNYKQFIKPGVTDYSAYGPKVPQ